MTDSEVELNNAAFRRMEDRIKSAYPPGRFVSLMGGEIVADGSDLAELDERLVALGKDPCQAFVVQAGHKYPKYATILPLSYPNA